MKEYIKMTLATVTGLLLFGFISMFFSIAIIGALAAAGDTTPVMPKEAVLKIDFTKMTLAEQTTEADPLAMLQGGGEITPVGIYSAINAINAAAQDPAIRYIYMKPDAVAGGTAQIEEFRAALKNFRDSGKAIVLDLVLPVIVLIISCVIGMIYSGGFFSGETFVNAFSNCDASVGLALGSFVAIVLVCIYFIHSFKYSRRS